MCVLFFFFFFQAEDGIRDKLVTGVQTCALPIFDAASTTPARGGKSRADGRQPLLKIRAATATLASARPPASIDWSRSEERRVGKSVDLGGRRAIKKKKNV